MTVGGVGNGVNKGKRDEWVFKWAWAAVAWRKGMLQWVEVGIRDDSYFTQI